MSAMGQKRRCPGSRGTSVLPSGADIISLPRHVRLVPRSDINLSGHPKDDLSYNSKPRGSYLQPGGAQNLAW